MKAGIVECLDNGGNSMVPTISRRAVLAGIASVALTPDSLAQHATRPLIYVATYEG